MIIEKDGIEKDGIKKAGIKKEWTEKDSRTRKVLCGKRPECLENGYQTEWTEKDGKFLGKYAAGGGA